MTFDDAKMAEAIKNGDSGMLQIVMDTYSDMLLRTACLILKDLKLAEDVTQETFIKFYYNIGQFRFEASIKTYLMRILVNECRRKLRKNWFRRVVLSSFTDDNVGASDIADGSEDRMMLSEAIAKLDIKYREAILLHYYSDLPVKEIARILGQSEGTVKSRLKRGRGKLKELMQEADLFEE